MSIYIGGISGNLDLLPPNAPPRSAVLRCEFVYITKLLFCVSLSRSIYVYIYTYVSVYIYICLYIYRGIRGHFGPTAAERPSPLSRFEVRVCVIHNDQIIVYLCLCLYLSLSLSLSLSPSLSLCIYISVYIYICLHISEERR